MQSWSEDQKSRVLSRTQRHFLVLMQAWARGTLTRIKVAKKIVRERALAAKKIQAQFRRSRTRGLDSVSPSARNGHQAQVVESAVVQQTHALPRTVIEKKWQRRNKRYLLPKIATAGAIRGPLMGSVEPAGGTECGEQRPPSEAL